MNIIIICFCNFSNAAAHKIHHSPNVVGLSMDNYLLPYPIKLGPTTTLLIVIIMSPFFSNSGSNVETSRNDYLIRLYKICLHPKLDGLDDLIETPLAPHSHRRSAPCKEWGIIANSWGRICVANGSRFSPNRHIIISSCMMMWRLTSTIRPIACSSASVHRLYKIVFKSKVG